MRGPDTNKSDTTQCWFKVAVLLNNSDNDIVEKWYKGYLVVFPNQPVALNSFASYRHPSNEYFLWADKSKVQQTVTAMIELSKETPKTTKP